MNQLCHKWLRLTYKLIILIYIDHDFWSQKIKFLANLDRFGHISISVSPIFKIFSMNQLSHKWLRLNIKLINLTYIQHNFRGKKVKFLADLDRFDHISSSAYHIFKIFCLNKFSHKWLKLMYKVNIFDPNWAWF